MTADTDNQHTKNTPKLDGSTSPAQKLDNQQLRVQIAALHSNIYERAYQDGQNKSPYTPINNPQIDSVLALISASNTEAQIELLEKLIKDYGGNTFEVNNASTDFTGRTTKVKAVPVRAIEAEIKRLRK